MVCGPVLGGWGGRSARGEGFIQSLNSAQKQPQNSRFQAAQRGAARAAGCRHTCEPPASDSAASVSTLRSMGFFFSLWIIVTVWDKSYR